ncbi:methyl-accepting chemotaxis protein [Natronoflexus pectinivorans]|nr:PAS domain-containing protein [Natronoflexus pectinivorans]
MMIGILALLLVLFFAGWFLFLFERKKLKDISHKYEETIYVLNKNTHIDRNAANGVSKEMERLSIVARQTENAIMIMDPDGNIEWVNDGFTRMYGYTYEEFVSTLGSNIRQTSFSNEIEERLYKCTKLGESVTYEALNITRNGERLWTHTSLTPIYNDNQELTYLAAIDSDISRRREAGDELVDAIHNLSARISSLSHKESLMKTQTAAMMESIIEAGKLLDDSGQVIKFINDISYQVKILGLNASIEASNFVGTNGSMVKSNGFRVISGEIINFSEETRRHASKITNTMEMLQKSFQKMEASRLTVDEVTGAYYDTISSVRSELKRVERVATKLNE